MTYTRRQWATDLLHAIGNPSPTEPVIDFVAGWTAMETSAGGGASYNLLNTEQRAAGSWNFNSAGVQNFPTYTEGVDTNARVLENGLYNPLLQALETNDATALGLNGQPPSYGVQRSLTNWVKGPGYTSIDASYVNGVVSLAHSSSVPGQTFPGSPGSVATAPPSSGSSSSSGSSGGGLAPQTRTDPGYTTTSTTTSTPSSTGSSASDPFGIGAAEQNLVSLAAKIFQAIILLVVAASLIAIGLFLLSKPEVESAGAALSEQVEAAKDRPQQAFGAMTGTNSVQATATRANRQFNPPPPKPPKPPKAKVSKPKAAGGGAAGGAAVAAVPVAP